jgi:hypothetical protein
MRLQPSFFNIIPSISSNKKETPLPPWSAPKQVTRLTSSPRSYSATIAWARPEEFDETGGSPFSKKEYLPHDLSDAETDSKVRYWWRLYECSEFCGVCDEQNWTCTTIAAENVFTNNIANAATTREAYKLLDTVQLGEDGAPENIKVLWGGKLKPLTSYRFSVKTRTQYGDSKPTSTYFVTLGPDAQLQDGAKLSYVSKDRFKITNYNREFTYTLITAKGAEYDIPPDQLENYYVPVNGNDGESFIKVSGASQAAEDSIYTRLGVSDYTYRRDVIYSSPEACNCVKPPCPDYSNVSVNARYTPYTDCAGACPPGSYCAGYTCVEKAIVYGHRVTCPLNCPTWWPGDYCAEYVCLPEPAPPVPGEPYVPQTIYCSGIRCDTCWRPWYGWVRNPAPASYYKDGGNQYYFFDNKPTQGMPRTRSVVPFEGVSIEETNGEDTRVSRLFKLNIKEFGEDRELPEPPDWPEAQLFIRQELMAVDEDENGNPVPQVSYLAFVETPDKTENLHVLGGIQDIFITIYDRDGDEYSYHALTEKDVRIRFCYFRNKQPIGFGPQDGSYEDGPDEDGYYVMISAPEDEADLTFSVEVVFVPEDILSDNKIHPFSLSDEAQTRALTVARKHGIMSETDNVLRLKRR